MKTTLTKSLILVAFFLILSGAVLVFINTIVKPPMSLASNNGMEGYENNVMAEIQKFSTEQDENTLEKSYQRVTDMISYYFQEGCINEESKESVTSKFIEKYIPLFGRFCIEKFKRSVWDDFEMREIQNRDNILLHKELNSSLKKKISANESVIKNYFNAKALLVNTSYKGVDAAEQRIKQAKEYENMDYICNCTYIRQGLANYPASLEAKHFAYALSQIRKMDYDKANPDGDLWCYEFREKFVVPARNALNEYDESTEFYGISNQNRLNNEFENLWDRATDHYDEECLY